MIVFYRNRFNNEMIKPIILLNELNKPHNLATNIYNKSTSDLKIRLQLKFFRNINDI